MPRAARHLAEYASLLAAAGVFRALPYPAAMRAAGGLAGLLRPAARRRIREAERRVREALGPGLPEAEAARIVRAAWRNLFWNAAEMARGDGRRPGWARRHATDNLAERVGPHLASGRGAIVALLHAGNWDLAGVLARAAGFPVFSIARRQSNPWTDGWMNRMRSVSGMETIPNDSHLLRQAIRKLKRGLLLAMLPDVRVRTPSLPVRFLGKTANLGGGMALFSRAASVPVFPVFVWREGRDRHRIEALDPVWPDPEAPRGEDALRLTQAVVDSLQARVLERPEQYFWFNKRWVLDPLEPEADPGGAAPQYR